MKSFLFLFLLCVICAALFLFYKNKTEETIIKGSNQVAEQYLKDGKYESAFDEINNYYKFCLANDYVASTGVRHSFALTTLQKIIESSPENRKKFDQRCEEIETAIANSKTDRFKFDEQFLKNRNPQGTDEVDKATKISMLLDNLIIFNKARKMDQQTISTFEKIISTNPLIAKDNWNIMSEIVFKEKRYDIASHFITDLDKSCRQLISIRSKAMKENQILKKNKTFMNQQIKDLLDYGLATGQKATVKKIVKDLLKRDDVDPDHFSEYKNLLQNKHADK